MRARTFIPVIAALALAVTAPTTAAAQDDSPGQSIEVHGHWLIEVYDGEELVERKEFDNALAPDAANVLADILAVQDTVSAPAIVVYDTAWTIVEAVTEAEGDTVSLSTPYQGEDAGKILLSGWYVQDVDHTIGYVSYEVLTFEGTSWLNAPITLKEFATPIEVAADQKVNLAVTISFSG